MASTERSAEPVREHALAPEHLAACVALSRAAHWNQNESDWRLMLALGRGWGLTLPDGTLVASTLVLPYGAFAWVSMVLVLPGHRRLGYATRLLEGALEESERGGFDLVLDATPAGRDVYARIGFRATGSFKRYALDQVPQRTVQPSHARVRALEARDWTQALALDAPAFGASREPLLRALAARLPQAALVAERDGRIEGIAFGRDGREANQLGPVVARSLEAAGALLDAAIDRVGPPIYVDVADSAPELQARLERRGFALQRPFTRMVRPAHGRPPHAPGNKRLLYCPTGAEFG
jgi:GNAT superfamily N-acetyltransferase